MSTATLDTAFNLNQKVLYQLRIGYYPNSKDELEEIKKFLHQKAHSSDVLFNPSLYLAQPEAEVVQLSRNTRALTAPIRRLPVDVLCEIFAYCARVWHRLLERCYEDYALTIGGSSHRPQCPTLELTWVCSHWRSIIRDYPSLWSSLYIEADSNKISPQCSEIFLEYMTLSRQSPLKFFIAVCHGSTTDVLADYRILLDNLDRWQHVILDSTSVIWLDSMIPAGHCPNLQYLMKWETYDSQPPPCILSSAPSLCTYCDIGTVAWSKFTQFDCSHLTSLKVHVLRGKSIAHFFARMPNLKELYLGKFESEGRLITSVYGYQCKIAILNLSMNTLLPKIWEALQLPHLVSLSLYTSAYDENRWRPEYGTFLKIFSSLLFASQCSLQTLKLYAIPTKRSLTFISQHPSITDFVFSSDCFEPDAECSVVELLLALTIEEQRISRRKKHQPKPVFLPNLQSFSINMQTENLPPKTEAGTEPTTEPSSSIMTASILCRMVEARTASLITQPEHARVVRLQTLRLGLGSWIDKVGRRFIHERMEPLVTVQDEDIMEDTFGELYAVRKLGCQSPLSPPSSPRQYEPVNADVYAYAKYGFKNLSTDRTVPPPTPISMLGAPWHVLPSGTWIP
ncbi:hypothetical protein BDP27DRAFT_1428006 [Rhodocollybia butyracea]|uniref:F-box domain-containing protein n=1 Tax=Rhodocollybia butyracea TaxID=206335 RepID=A0A9P5PHV5_9AGAR|nr:hypothetical protein BDP27DRAFT_1428006 [Rhodocollybia butyracea]